MSAEGFYKLFAGLERAYGTYVTNSSDIRDDGKIGGRATTMRGTVTPSLWQNHLDGKASLGIVPINDKGECRFGAIDIDVYNLDIESVLVKLEPLKTKLLPCLSKSGGLHLYMFTEEWVPAITMQKKLKEIAAIIGYGQSEIFPKQTKLLASRGDVGGWINMPYFDTKQGNRVMVVRGGKTFSSLEFLEYASKNKVPRSLLGEKVIKSDTNLSDGPPCLEILTKTKLPTGSRNRGLFNLGVYLRKSKPDTWKDVLPEYNTKYLDPPLSNDEVQQTIKSISRKNYEYTCSQEPICNYCNLGVCKNRKYGVGESASMPILHSLTKFDTKPPIWFVDVQDGGRLELTTDDLQNQRRFQKRCLESLNMMPVKMGDTAWSQLVNNLLDSLIVIEFPKDASDDGQLLEYIEAFCHQKAQAKEKDELILGKPWVNTDDSRHYFRMKDLMAYLERHRFKSFRVHEVTALIKIQGAEHHFFRIKGKGVNCWSLSFFPDANHQLKEDKTNG